jgi:D-alanine--D-alanine ligase
MKLGILFGGHGPERGISLNSARSLMDHIPDSDIELTLLYLDPLLRPYRLQRSQLYSNTPSDFDFKLAGTGQALSDEQYIQTLKDLDLLFPAIHGSYGEDGTLQSLLEGLAVPFVGAGSASCGLCFDKYVANEFIREQGFYAPASLSVERSDLKNLAALTERIHHFLSQSTSRRLVVKPATGGSSIGVSVASNVEDAIRHAEALLAGDLYGRVVIEEFCAGQEFTVVLLQNSENEAVALMPIGIETDYSNFQIFDYRKKYLPTKQVSYHCPPKYSAEITKRIMTESERLFALFGMKDFARFDGWVLPNGELWFSDFNPISGMEQNSFLFIAGARLGMSHKDIVSYIIRCSATRQQQVSVDSDLLQRSSALPVNVLFGDTTAERQVSVMSGTNVWLKLKNSKRYEPKPFFLDSSHNVWELPYSLALNHTVEEIEFACKQSTQVSEFEAELRRAIQSRLGNHAVFGESNFVARELSLEDFLRNSAFLFLGLHGGVGEDGTLQRRCEELGIPYNGSPSSVCALSVDKFAFGRAVEALKLDGVESLVKVRLDSAELKTDAVKLSNSWHKLQEQIGSPPYVVKPNSDGCSAGVCRLDTQGDFETYLRFLFDRSERIPAGELSKQESIIEMPSTLPEQLIIEKFVVTDRVAVSGTELIWQTRSGWIEVTIGVIETQSGLKSFSPSITIASDAILSVEEKFQGGTGINITPPPTEHVSPQATSRVRASIELLASKIGIRGYGRFDAFMNIHDGSLIIIELNNLPALTPSTVLFQQALESDPTLMPTAFLEHIIEQALPENLKWQPKKEPSL